MLDELNRSWKKVEDAPGDRSRQEAGKHFAGQLGQGIDALVQRLASEQGVGTNSLGNRGRSV